jgi:hypothetical protein
MNIALINFGSFSNDPLEHHHRSNDCVRWWDDSIGILERGGDISYSTEWLEYHHRYWKLTKWLCEMILLGHWNEGDIFPTHQWLEYHHRSLHLVVWYDSLGILERGENTYFLKEGVLTKVLILEDVQNKWGSIYKWG